MRKTILAGVFLAMTAPVIGLAGVANDVPSCYAANHMPIAPVPPSTELFILVDQTTILDASLQNSVRENVSRLVRAGSAFVVSEFSSFGQGRYLNVVTAGTLEAPIDQSQRDDISVKLLRGFDECMAGQLAYGRRTVATALNKALSGSSSDLAKSDILGSLKEISDRVRQSPAKDKVVLVVSDMLENSGISSFYEKRNVRMLDVPAELRKAEMAKQVGDFGGARVFVLGAGIIQDIGDKHHDSGVYRSPKTMAALKEFWERYFAESHARLMEFGMPALLSPVQ